MPSPRSTAWALWAGSEAKGCSGPSPVRKRFRFFSPFVIKVELVSAVGILTDVKWLKTMTVLTMLALWLPATNHCRLEQIPGLSFLVCCDHEAAAPHQDNDCDTDGCAQFENGLYKVDDARAVAVVPAFVGAVFLLPTVEQTPPPPPLLSDFSTVASPELPGTWQFSFRTALPPRAPSFAS